MADHKCTIGRIEFEDIVQGPCEYTLDGLTTKEGILYNLGIENGKMLAQCDSQPRKEQHEKILVELATAVDLWLFDTDDDGQYRDVEKAMEKVYKAGIIKKTGGDE